ncbi:MAG: hypothetical protein WC554_15935 [Clostridia bacterium]
MVYKSRNLLGKNKEKVKENIKDYSHFKTLFIMTKLKSIFTVIFCFNPEDDYIVYVIRYRTKSGMISESSVVLQPDIPRWTRIYEEEGFVKI